MAWKNKGWTKGRTRRSYRKIPMRAIPRGIARTRKQWITVANTMSQCHYQCIEWTPGNCKTNVLLGFLENEDLQSLFGDNCSVAALRGSISFLPIWQVPYDRVSNSRDNGAFWNAYINNLDGTIIQARCGLKRSEVTPAFPDGLFYDPADSFNFSDGQWLKLYNHQWSLESEKSAHYYPVSAVYGICPTVTSSNSILTDGSGTIDGVDTTCTIGIKTAPVTPTTPQLVTVTIPPVKPWILPINYRRKIRMKENEELNLHCAFERLFGDSTCFPGEANPCGIESGGLPCNIKMVWNLRALIEY